MCHYFINNNEYCCISAWYKSLGFIYVTLFINLLVSFLLAFPDVPGTQYSAWHTVDINNC